MMSDFTDELEMVYVRRCKICNVTRPIGQFSGMRHASRKCYKCALPYRGYGPGIARSIAITDLGYRTLREFGYPPPHKGAA